MRSSRNDNDNDNDARRRRRPSTPPLQASRTQSFTCSADLLRAFEHRAFELGCSFDWLLEEAMQRLLAEGSDLETLQLPSDERLPPAHSVQQVKALSLLQALPLPLPPDRPAPTTVPPPPARAKLQAPPAQAAASPWSAGRPTTLASATSSVSPVLRSTTTSSAPPPPARAASPAPPASPAATAAARGTRSPTANAVAEPLVLYYGDERLVIGHHPYVIGRSGNVADLVIEDSEVSRRHAVIEHTAYGWVITDLGSTNGIIVNGEAVRYAVLRAGAMMSIGPMAFRVASPG